MLARGDTKVRGRSCERRCGPSRRGARNASAALKNFVRQQEKTFSTLSANCGHSKVAHYAILPRACCVQVVVRHGKARDYFGLGQSGEDQGVAGQQGICRNPKVGEK
jgi:hypothetical protein